MAHEYYGYVYIWYDTKYKKYIIGSHHGTVDDRYKTSTGGIHVRNIFKHRPGTMRFKVLEYNYKENTYKFTQQLEQKWLDKRPNIKTNKKYYNMTNQAGGGFDSIIQLERIKNKTHHFLGGVIQRKSNLERVKRGLHNFQTIEHKNKVKFIAQQKVKDGTHHFCTSSFNNIPFKIICSDGRIWEFKSKVAAVRYGFTAGIIDKLKVFKQFTYSRGSIQKTKIKFNAGDTLDYQQI